MSTPTAPPKPATTKGPVNPARQRLPWRDYSWFHEQVYTDNDLYFKALLKALDRAQTSIILATYIFQYDHLGQAVIERLCEAHRRGVTVRVLFDGFGSLETAETIVTHLEDAGIDVKIFHPLPWQPENYRRALGRTNWLSNLTLSLLRLNQRHHAKLCIIDDFTLWCGSQNIIGDHLSEEEGGKNWHDLGATVSGTGVKAIVETFEDLWFHRKPRIGSGLFKYYWNNLTALTRQQKNKRLAQRIANTQTRLWIINPYFSPTRSIIRAIRTAARHGADVRLIVPAKSDIQFFPLLTATYYDELLRYNVRIFEYLPSILHAKLLIADEFYLMGSTNLNHRSLLHDVEFDIVLDSTPSKRQLETQFSIDQGQSREITRRDLKPMGFRRLLGWLPWLLRYWL